MRDLYESAILEMKSLLEDTVENFSMAHEVYTMEPLFCVSNKQFPLMRQVARFSNYQVLNGCKRLCIDMCRRLDYSVSEIREAGEIDFIIKQDSKNIGF